MILKAGILDFAGRGMGLMFSSVVFENFAAKELNTFVIDNMKKYFELVQNKIDLEQEVGDTNVFVQALDRFYKRIESNTLCRDVDFTM